MNITYVTDNILNIKIGEHAKDGFGMIHCEKHQADAPKMTYAEKKNSCTIFDPEGKELQMLRFETEEIDIEKYHYGETEYQKELTVDGLHIHAAGGKKVPDRKGYKAKIHFSFQKDEAVYGLGSQEEGLFNLRGQYRHLYQHNFKAINPFLISTNHYGILFDCYSAMIFRDDEQGSYMYLDAVSGINIYIIYGENADKIIAGYRYLTGQVPLLPKWAFGYIQSKERYHSAKELIEIASEYRKREIPLDCIVLDWQSWTGNLWGNKILDPERFPNPENMMEQLHDMHTKLMVSVWPNMFPGGENYEEMREKNYLLANDSTYDAFNEEARELYWKQANEGLWSKGIDAWWCDCSEPFEGDWRGQLKPEPEQRYYTNTEETKKYLDPEFINAYPLLHSKGIYEGQRKTTDEKRVINLTRSNYLGQQRFGTVVWSGDVSASWETLQKQVAESLNFVSSGVPYWTVDIGGFFVSPGTAWFIDGQYPDGVGDDAYKELYVRWLQWGTFLPMMRSHGTGTPREVWRFGEEGTVYYDTIIKFIKLRYRLLPYIYSLAAKVTFESYTMMRPLFFDFSDIECRDMKDQFMMGDIMVCPVLEANAVKREVYLPHGNWYDYWTNEKLAGGRWISADVDVTTIPLYVKEGSIIVTGSDIQHSGEQQEYTINVYAGKSCEFQLYEDSGDGYGYEKGEYQFTPIKYDGTKVWGINDYEVKMIGL